MAIQDQCNRCKKNGTSECNSEVPFDGRSCESYEKKGIDLEKHQTSISEDIVTEIPDVENESSSNEEETITSEWLRENTEISGWLTFFLFSVVVGGFISMAYSVFTFDVSEYGGSYLLPLADAVTGVMLFALAIYTLIAFTKRKPDAVFLAKVYVVAIFVSSLLGLFGGDFEANGFGSLKQLVRSLIWSIIWFLYLCNSTQVEEVIPSEFRARTAKDYYIIAAMILIPLAGIGGGIAEIAYNNNRTEASFIENTQLGEDEYTDGRVIFKKPMGFSCNRKDIEEPRLTIYELEGYDNSSITICSDYDSDMSYKNFKEYRENWQDDSVDEISHNDYDAGTYMTDKFDKYWHQTRKYENDEVCFYWDFAMLFNQKSGKVVVVSYYLPSTSDNIIKDLLNSIRFE